MPCYKPRRVSTVTPPASEPLSLAEAKLFLRVDATADDMLIETLIAAVREAAEQHLRRSLITRTLKLTTDQLLESATVLPFGPVTAIESITAIAVDESSVLVDTDDYYLLAAEDRLHLTQPIYAHRIVVEYTAGYGESDIDVPAPLRQGMLLHLAALYDNREGEAGLPAAAAMLYAPFREIGI